MRKFFFYVGIFFAAGQFLGTNVAAQSTVPPFDVPWFSLGGTKPDTGYCPVGVSPTEVRWTLCNFSSVPTPIPIDTGGTNATATPAARQNLSAADAPLTGQDVEPPVG